jgi:tetratricopeptide (TPR) repeat protein
VTADAASTEELIEMGLRAQRQGDHRAARASYGRALEADPENPEALHLLGLIEAAHGRLDEGVALLERAVARDPSEPLFRINLARAFKSRRELARAAAELRAAVRLAPNDEGILFELGVLEQESGALASALRIFEGLARANPASFDAIVRFGDCALFSGDARKAVAAANRLHELAPERPEAIRLATGAAILEKNWLEAERLARDWTRRFPQEANGWKVLANALYELGRRDEAKTAFDEVLRREPGVPANRVVADVLARFVKRHADAHAHLEDAQNAEIDTAEEAAALAVLGIHAGQFQDAERLALRAIELDPGDLRSYLHYASLKEGDVPDAHLAALETANAAGAYPPHLGGRLAFALGAIHEARGDIATAFEMFRLGNERKLAAARAEGLVFDAAAEAERTRSFAAFFKSRPAPPPYPRGPFAPIFVVGMPRSGTTLAESVLAAHPDVFGAGELVALNAVHRDIARWASENPGVALEDAPLGDLRRWRERYFEGCPDAGGARRLVDKQPANHQSIGLAPLLFPEARIVHMRRNPVETCFSIWRRDFSKGWTYANRFEDLAARYGEYARLTAHWESVLGPEYLFVQYEDLVADFDGVGRRMAEHCGLDWREEMRDFHAAKRMVTTFSATQVRRPLFRQGLDKAAKYGALLDPLRAALEKAGVDLQTGAYVGG